jgi:alpha-galactosidase
MEYRSNLEYDVTRFGVKDDRVWLESLAGMVCGMGGRDEGPQRAKGLYSLKTSEGNCDLDPLRLIDSELKDNTVRLIWQNPQDSLRLESHWTFSPREGVWSRSDKLVNISQKAIHVYRCLAQFVFTPGVYEFYHQSSDWCRENQGDWRAMGSGKIIFNSEGGRTCQVGTPYLCLRDRNNAGAAAFHIIPRGNWMFELAAETHTPGNISHPFMVIRAGLSDEYLNFPLNPGQSFALPEILIQSLPAGSPEQAAPYLHRYWLEREPVKKTLPVIYNTWFDDFEFLTLPRLRKQLNAAKAAGCEIFVVDAGWYGAGEGNWWQQCGDWREKKNAAFGGNMKVFADEVRAAGLGFGIWMDAEAVDTIVPLAKEKPDWLLRSQSGCFYYDLENPDGYRYLFSEISRVLSDYDAVFIKIDFNRELGIDPNGTELAGYYEAWYRMIDQLHQRHPKVFFEACASGGMRSDLNTLSRFDNHFLSDTAEPTTLLRIYQGALLRLPPGPLSKWIVLRDVGKSIARYGTPIEQVAETVVAPSGATWEQIVSADIDFSCCVCLAGMPGFSGDMAGLNPAAADRIRFHVDFYKKWRSLLADSAAHLLTPVRPISDRTGWAAIQCQGRSSSTSLMFVYRLDDLTDTKTLYPMNLSPDRKYRVANVHAKPDAAGIRTGSDLMRLGVPVSLAKKFAAAIVEITED